MCWRDMPGGYFMQVRYPFAAAWETVGVYETRAAARGDIGAYSGLRNPRGMPPKQLRLVRGDDLDQEPLYSQALRWSRGSPRIS